MGTYNNAIIMQEQQPNDIDIKEHPKISSNVVPIYNLVHHEYIINNNISCMIFECFFFDKQGHMPNRNPWPQWVCLEPTCSRGATIPTNGCYWAQVTGDPTRDWLLENCGFFSVMKSSEFKIMLLTCCCRIYM